MYLSFEAVFVFISAKPRSDSLPAAVLRNRSGFVLTDQDLRVAAECARVWKEHRDPRPFETSVPGVFAAGDVRAGAMNRVASAVCEGSMGCGAFTNTWRCRESLMKKC